MFCCKNFFNSTLICRSATVAILTVYNRENQGEQRIGYGTLLFTSCWYIPP